MELMLKLQQPAAEAEAFTPKVEFNVPVLNPESSQPFGSPKDSISAKVCFFKKCIKLLGFGTCFN